MTEYKRRPIWDRRSWGQSFYYWLNERENRNEKEHDRKIQDEFGFTF